MSSLLTFGLFLIAFARIPNRRVEMVSASLKAEGEHVMIREVLALPPSESYSTRVSLESRYGTWEDFLSVSANMTFPKADKDLLMFFASSSLFPSAPVFPTFSLPARSTKYNFPVLLLKSNLEFC